MPLFAGSSLHPVHPVPASRGKRLRVLAAAALALAGASPTPLARAQEAGAPMPIAAALLDRDGDRRPDRLGAESIVEGVVTQRPHRTRQGRGVLRLQDSTGGVTLVASSEAGTFDGLAPGDRVRVRGVVQQERGREQLAALAVRTVGRGTVPAPRDVLAADLHGERYASQLVRLHGTLVSHPQRGASGGRPFFELEDRSGRVRVFVPTRLLAEEGGDRLLRGGEAEIVGIASQHQEQPFDGGYELVVRDVADVRFVTPLPVGRVLLAVALCLLAAFAGHVAWRRRQAEARARELERLYEELRRSDEALAESERRHRLLFERNPLPMWLYDVETFRILEVNAAAVDHYGYSRDEFLGLTIAQLLPEEDVPQVLATRATPGAGRRKVPAHRTVTKDGRTIVVEVVSDDAWVSGRPARIVLALDVTQREQLEAQLRQAQKMDAVGQLAGGVAHDFNNLLTVITAYSSMLLDEQPAPEVAADLREIRDAARRATALTRQLLAFSRKQMLQPRVVSLDTLVVGVQGMLRRLIGEDVRMVTVAQPALGQVRADPGQLEQVLVNLAVNARDAMRGGGTLTIEVANAEIGAAGLRSPAGVVPAGSYVSLTVSDTGCGMDLHTQARIFEPFFTTKEVGKGTGLGLSTVYGIVKQSDGYLWVRSAPGEGATFRLFLPRVAATDAPREPADVADGPSRAPEAAGETVLLVEDDAGVRQLASRVLTRLGYAVLEARDGRDALELARRHPARIDLLLTDVVMPEMNGREVAERLTAARPGLRVLYMSGYTDDEIVRRGLLARGVTLLQKPFVGDQLATTVREVLDAGMQRAVA